MKARKELSKKRELYNLEQFKTLMAAAVATGSFIILLRVKSSTNLWVDISRS